MNRIAWVAPLLLTGCDLFEQGKDVFEGLTNTLVAQGIVLGVEPPPGDVELEGLEEGATFGIFLADAADAGEMEDAPITGADVEVNGPPMGATPASETTDGAYSADSTDGLEYQVNAAWDVEVTIGSYFATADVTLPAAAQITVPQTHSVDTAMNLDVSGQGFHTAVIIVSEATQGVTYTNEPEGIGDLYDRSQASQTLDTIQIPRQAFPSSGAYVVGVAGMKNTKAADLDEMNTALSNVMAGKMVFNATAVP